MVWTANYANDFLILKAINRKYHSVKLVIML